MDEIVALWTDGVLLSRGGFVDEPVALWIHGVLWRQGGLVDELVGFTGSCGVKDAVVMWTGPDLALVRAGGRAVGRRGP